MDKAEAGAAWELFAVMKDGKLSMVVAKDPMHRSVVDVTDDLARMVVLTALKLVREEPNPASLARSAARGVPPSKPAPNGLKMASEQAPPDVVIPNCIFPKA